MKLTGAFLTEHADMVDGALDVKGGVCARLTEDPESGQMLVSIVALVKGEEDDADRTLKIVVESISTPDKAPRQELSEKVPSEALAHRAGGFTVIDLRFSREDLPVEGWYEIVVTGPKDEKFQLPFLVGTAAS